MIVTLSAILGALIGGLTAQRRGGTRLDMAQYAATFALVFGIIGLFISVFVARAL